ncbi:MAG: coproporphyrinogen III oxidase [Cyanobacteria bacterium QS_4_48_99]|nr:MAG: coproporphyrinogen III oxidase [Cyanobacteria bacterium QS_4_48_99]
MVDQTEFRQLEAAETTVPRSAYVHIPFCRRRCYYCDFPIAVLGDRATNGRSSIMEGYIEQLCREIEATPAWGHPLETVSFGGGTPSLLPVPQLERILNTLDRHFGIAAGAEISMEVDPDTFSAAQLLGYKHAGVNRVSLGAQAFQDELLKVCGRSHSSDDIFAAVELIRQVGIPNFSLDLISGLPHQTLNQWQASLETAVKIAPAHLSCYDLMIEPVTAFGRQYQPGENPLPTDETTTQMYKLAGQIIARAGYEHYEICNYAQPGYQSRHNRIYWENRPYYGFGMGAASYVQRQRFTRPRTRKDYYAWVQQFQEAGGAIDCSEISATEVLLETLMLGLRLADGISLSWIRQQFGEATLKRIWTCLQTYYQQGWVELMGVDEKRVESLPAEGRLRLSDPEGFLFSNVVLAALFSQFEED